MPLPLEAFREVRCFLQLPGQRGEECALHSAGVLRPLTQLDVAPSLHGRAQGPLLAMCCAVRLGLCLLLDFEGTMR